MPADILTAVRPALATTAGPLILITTPYARRGEVWDLYRRYYGPGGDQRILCVQGATRDFNPTLPQAVVDRALECDYAAASAEYLAIFRTDIESFVSREALAKCVDVGILERAPVSNVSYLAFVDPSGGSADSMTLGVSHRESSGVMVLDCLREVRPPFSPEDVVYEFCETLRQFRVTSVKGDRYAGEWPRERFREKGIAYKVSDKSKADLYLEFLPQLNSGRVRLLDQPRLVNQLAGLERRTARGTGRDVIDHPPGAHDDVANACVGCLVTKLLYPPALDWVRGESNPEAEAAEYLESRYQNHIRATSNYWHLPFQALRRVW